MQRATPPAAIKKVSVTLQDLVETTRSSGDLFAAQEIRSHKLALSQAMDNLNVRFGRNTVNLGPPAGKRRALRRHRDHLHPHFQS